MRLDEGMKYRKRSTAKDRAAAVALYESSGKTAKVLAAELGMPAKTLESWIRLARRRQIDPEDTLSREQINEVSRLRRKVKSLERDVDFLKKADAFYRELDQRERNTP